MPQIFILCTHRKLCYTPTFSWFLQDLSLSLSLSLKVGLMIKNNVSGIPVPQWEREDPSSNSTAPPSLLPCNRPPHDAIAVAAAANGVPRQKNASTEMPICPHCPPHSIKNPSFPFPDHIPTAAHPIEKKMGGAPLIEQADCGPSSPPLSPGAARVEELPKISLPSCSSTSSHYPSTHFTDCGNDSFTTARPSGDETAAGIVGCGSRIGDGRNSVGYGSEVSDESSTSSFGGSSNANKPHKANDSNWEAIRVIRSRDGVLGLSHFRLLKKLGCGDIGSVYLSELSGTRSLFAMKVMDKAALASRKKLPRAQTEREILQCLDHPFLPTLYTHFETDKFSCLVMEFCPGGDLHSLRQRQPEKHFSEKAARFYVAEVLLALEYLHMLGIIYRDLKPENVLVREDGHIMLSDFDLSLRCAVCPTLVKTSNMGTGHSKNTGYCVQPSCVEPTCVIQSSCLKPTTCFAPRFLSSKSKKDRKSKPKQKDEVYNQSIPLPELVAEPTSARSMSFVGTHEYLAPEIIKGEGHGSAVDWWTFGIFLYELLFGKTPFKGSGNRATLFNVVGEPLRFPESPVVSFAARDLIRGLLVKEPQQRLAYRRGATEIKQHPFFQSVNWALIRSTNPPEVPLPFEHYYSLPATASMVPKSVNTRVDVKPSGKYLDMDFF